MLKHAFKRMQDHSQVMSSEFSQRFDAIVTTAS